MSGDLIEERPGQRIQEEFARVTGRVPPEVRAIYEQNPLGRFLLNAPAKDVVAYHKKIWAQLRPRRRRDDD